MVNIFLFIVMTFLSHFNFPPDPSNRPVRLEKKEVESSFEKNCRKACPYILLVCVIIFSVLLFCILVKYGHSFSTEANQYEHLQQITTAGR